MAASLAAVVRELGEEEFVRRMEELSSGERREIFQHLGVAAGGPSASARQRTLRRIRIAWGRLQEAADDEAAELFARTYLASRRMPMIVEFLDRLGIPHQDGYLADTEPLERLTAAEAGPALADLASRHDPRDVLLYATLMALPGTERVRA